MRIPRTINACAVAIANLGHRLYVNGVHALVTDNLPVEGLLAYIFFNEEHDSLEATFVFPGRVADDFSAGRLANIIHASSPGLCRFRSSDCSVQGKSSLFLSAEPTLAQIQSWWRLSLAEARTWWEQAHSYGVLVDNTTPAQPQLALDQNTMIVENSEPVADTERCAPVTTQRVVEAVTRFSGIVPDVRQTPGHDVVEITANNQFVDIQVLDEQLVFLIGTATNVRPSRWKRKGLEERIQKRLVKCLNDLYALEPAPPAHFIVGEGKFELYTCAVADSSVGLDDDQLETAVKLWLAYTVDFQERTLTAFEAS